MEKYPAPLLLSAYETVEKARAFVREGKYRDGALHVRLREASETLRSLIAVQQSTPIDEQPFWYNLYDSIVGRYVNIKSHFLRLQETNKLLRKENKELKEKYWDAISRLKEIPKEAEAW